MANDNSPGGIYHRIGDDYASQRQSDPRWVSLIQQALAGHSSLINVGAGAGILRARVHVRDRSGAVTHDDLPAVPVRRTGGVWRRGAVALRRGCMDGFLGAYWRRPRAYLDPTVRNAISGLALLDSAVVATKMAQLELDLADGSWLARYSKLMELDEVDLGYRLVIAGP